MDAFLEKHNLPKGTLEETENLNSPVFTKETEFIIKHKCSSNKENSSLRWLHCWILQNIKGRNDTNSRQTIPENRGRNTSELFFEATCSPVHLFFEARGSLAPSPDKDITRQVQTDIPYKELHKNHQNTRTSDPETHSASRSGGFIAGTHSWFYIKKSVKR